MYAIFLGAQLFSANLFFAQDDCLKEARALQQNTSETYTCKKVREPTREETFDYLAEELSKIAEEMQEIHERNR